MIRPSPGRLTTACVGALALLLAACGSTPPAPQPLPKAGVKQEFQQDLGDGFTLKYAIERTPSRDHPRACFAFISGVLHNNSPRILSKKSVLDVIVSSRGKMLFRDIANPVADIPPGNAAMFGMIDSPVHKDGCPDYERIDITLRKVYLN